MKSFTVTGVSVFIISYVMSAITSCDDDGDGDGDDGNVDGDDDDDDDDDDILPTLPIYCKYLYRDRINKFLQNGPLYHDQPRH